jgi:hypothetical protein
MLSAVHFKVSPFPARSNAGNTASYYSILYHTNNFLDIAAGIMNEKLRIGKIRKKQG